MIFGRSESAKLVHVIQPYMISSMMYKIGLMTP